LEPLPVLLYPDSGSFPALIFKMSQIKFLSRGLRYYIKCLKNRKDRVINVNIKSTLIKLNIQGFLDSNSLMYVLNQRKLKNTPRDDTKKNRES
jgi:hypothetical protein